MINLLSIKEMTLKITTAVTEVILKEVEEFKIREKSEDKTRIAFEIVEPIISSALGGIMTIFARLRYSREEVLAITGLIFDQYVILEEKFLQKEKLGQPLPKEQFQTVNIKVPTNTPKPDADINSDPRINVKGAKGIN